MKECLFETTVYYTVITIVYQIGLSTSQISHMAMIPELSTSEEVRASLTLIRNSMTALANILGYLAALIAFSYGK